MPDYRSMYSSDYLGAWDLTERDVTVTVARFEKKELIAAGKKAESKPVLFFEGAIKGFVVNKTNGKTIARMYGRDISKWVGQKITLYATETQVGREMEPCIRVRPVVPAEKGAK